MENHYDAFFQELKSFIVDLGIEKQKDVQGCNSEEIKQIEDKFGDLPLAYKTYLKVIGRNFLFNFFDAEQFSYSDYEDIQEFASEFFENINFYSGRKIIPIAHRRYDYLRIIFLDEEKDNPDLWELFDSHKEEKIPVSSNQTLTELMVSYFQMALLNHSYSFNFVSEKDLLKNPKLIKKRYKCWFAALDEKKLYIDNCNTTNTDIKKLHKVFLNYYDCKVTPIYEELDEYIAQKAKSHVVMEGLDKNASGYPGRNLIQKIIRFLKV